MGACSEGRKEGKEVAQSLLCIFFLTRGFLSSGSRAQE